MKTRTIHKYLGLIMVLPFIAWAATGLFFFIKPGYDKAYERLSVKTYPMNGQSVVVAGIHDEVRVLKTVLGQHLIAKIEGKWQHIDVKTNAAIAMPSETQVRLLVDDAIRDNPRYGQIESLDGLSIETTTGVKITLNWNQLSFYQRGKDTDFIDQMYKIHYLQWTGNKQVDRYLGVIGLGLVTLLALIGVWLTFKPRRRSQIH